LLRRVAESAGDDLRVMPIAARAPLRFYSVGAGRMTQDEVAALPQELKKKAEVERLELARQSVPLLPRETPAIATESAPDISSSETPAVATVSVQAAPREILAEPANEPPAGTVDPHQLFEMVNDRELATRIGHAFTTGDFDAAAGIGWGAIASLSTFPDLTYPVRFAEAPTTHWFWQSALATLATDRGPPSDVLEQYLRRFADSMDIRRAQGDAAGLIFAAATTIALGRRPSPETVEVTDKLTQIFQRPFSITTHSDLRLLAIQMLWRRNPQRFPDLEVRIPFDRIQLFSPDLFDLNPDLVRGFDAVKKFIHAARSKKMSSTDADSFTTSTEYSLILTRGLGSNALIGRLFIGVTPELYDNAVRALIDADNLSYGAVDRAIEEIVGRASFWPADLFPGNTSWLDQDLRSGFLAKVIVHADRCGLLLPLLEQATAVNASKLLPKLARLVRRYEEIRNPGYRSGPPTS
jgi:hypothetical protein